MGLVTTRLLLNHGTKVTYYPCSSSRSDHMRVGLYQVILTSHQVGVLDSTCRQLEQQYGTGGGGYRDYSVTSHTRY